MIKVIKNPCVTYVTQGFSFLKNRNFKLVFYKLCSNKNGILIIEFNFPLQKNQFYN